MAEAELRRHRIRLKLQEKPFQLLAKLLERPGTVVSREELREKLWTDDTYVDFERSLNVAMSKLRAALVLACCGLSGDAALEKNFHRHETDLEKVRELFAREQRFWEVALMSSTTDPPFLIPIAVPAFGTHPFGNPDPQFQLAATLQFPEP